MVNLTGSYGWRFAVCSFENPVRQYASELAEKLIGAPFWDGPTRRMSEPDLIRTLE
jgi:twinkle protein